MTRIARVGLVVLLLVAACGDDDAATTTTLGTSTVPATTTTTTAAGTTTTIDDDTVEIVVDGTYGTLQLSVDGESRDLGERVAVDLGDTVRIVVTLAETNEVHIHTYDLSLAAPEGEQVELEFVADIAGIFEVELHEGGTLLFELEVA